MNLPRKQLTSLGLLVLRVGISCMMLVHGLAKFNGFSDMADAFPDPIGMGSKLSLIMAIAAEVGCSLLLIFGFASRLVAIPLAFTMLVALFVVHAEDPWKVRELAAVYLLVYVSLVLTGPGAISLDHLLFGRRTTEAGSEKGAV